MTDKTATVATFRQDGVTYEIDEIGIGWPSYDGWYVLYRGDEQLGEFLGESAEPATLIEQAQALLRGQSR